MSGGGGGKIKLWDISKDDPTKQTVQTFTESGIYQRDPNLLNEVFDGKFSSCGKHFVISTVWGTFTIYSIYGKESYYATPVEQFFQYDKLPQAYSNIYNDEDAYLCNFDRMKYPEQPPYPIIGQRYLTKKISHNDYEQEYMDRYSKFSKDQKFFENYAEEYAPYALTITDQRNNEEDENSSSRQMNNDDSDSGNQRPNRNNNRSMYYDPNNDRFDRESDEDFVVDSSPEHSRPTRRTIRRQTYYQDRNQNREEEKKNNQSNARNLRRLNRNKQNSTVEKDPDASMEEISNEDPDDFKLDEDEQDSEENYSDEYTSERQSRLKPSTTRNHNFYSSKIDDEDSEEIISVQNPSRQTNKPTFKNPFFGVRRIIVEENKRNIVNNYQIFLHKNDDEDYVFKSELKTSGYRIDIEEALAMKNQDKSQIE